MTFQYGTYCLNSLIMFRCNLLQKSSTDRRSSLSTTGAL